MVSKQVRRALLASQIHRQQNELELWTTRGQDDQFSSPRQIRWSEALGKLLVGDNNNKRASIRRPDLSYFSKIYNTVQEYTWPAIDTDDENLYGSTSNAVMKRSPEGVYITRTSGADTVLSVRMIDASGNSTNVYATSDNATDGHGVRKIRKSDMAVVASLLATGSGNGQFQAPLGVFYYDDGTAHVYIADTGNNRIVKLLASDLSFVANISLAYSPLDLCTDGVNWYVQGATTLYKYDMSFTDGTKASTAITGYSITIVPDQSDGNGQTIAISDNINCRLHRVKCSDLTLVRTIGSIGDGSLTLVPLRVDFPATYAGTARWELSDGEIIPAVSGAAISWNGFTGYTPRTAGARAVLKGVPLSALTRLDANTSGLVGDITTLRLDRFRSNLVDLRLYSTDVSGDISNLAGLSKLEYLYLHTTSATCGSTFTASWVGMQNFQVQNCLMSQAAVGNIVESIWDARAGFTYATPELNVGGTNAAPAGNVAAPPGAGASNSDWNWNAGTGKYEPLTAGAMIWDLAKDVNSEGFNKWAITYNGGSI